MKQVNTPTHRNMRIILTTFMFFALATIAYAETFFVTNTNSSGEGSFRKAVADANASPTDDIIQFDENVFDSTNTLRKKVPAQVTILNNGSLTINGTSPLFVEIDGKVDNIRSQTMDIARGAVVFMNDLSITGGFTDEASSAGLFSEGTVTMTNCHIKFNRAGISAGGVSNRGTLTLIDSQVNNNSANDGSGGGIFNSGTLTVENVEFFENRAENFGGGIYNRGTVTLNNATFKSNSTVDSDGGGIHNLDTLTITNSFFMDNFGEDNGGAISNTSEGTLDVKDTTFESNTAEENGGGVDNKGVFKGERLTFNLNFADANGGAISNDNSLDLRNSTISRNESEGFWAGGIYNESGATGTIVNSTIVYNTNTFFVDDIESGGGGLHNNGGELSIANTIVSLNTAPNGYPNISGTITSNGFNLIGDPEGGTIVGNTNGNILNADPMVAGLADYGGMTKTHKISDVSPARDAGSNSLAVDAEGNPFLFDQRGEGFERIISGTVDIGSFEIQTGASCTFEVTADPGEFSAAGGTGTIAVLTQEGCNWTVENSPTWITVSGTGGSGNGSVDFTVSATNGAARSGNIILAGQSITINQAGNCTYEIDRDTFIATRRGGAEEVEVTAGPGCEWTVSVGVPWITLTGDPGGSGNGTVEFIVAENNTGENRDGTLTIAGFTVEVSQTGLNPTAPAPTKFDYNGDGKAELSVFRDQTGRWYVNDLENPVSEVQFGIPGDIIVPADYDGDGITDQGIFRNGKWYVKQSTDGTEPEATFGLEGDVPIAGDYDGDGKADKAIFRDGIWYILSSIDSNVRIEQFGIEGDKPLSGDFDGDGKDDLAVYRPSNRVWYTMQSRDGFTALQFGLPDDKLVPMDYDGDGKTDIAVFRDGTWYIYQSSDGNVAITGFGLEGDMPVPADYDGDGQVDLAVYRQGVWYILQSTNGFMAIQFGIDTDTPTPNAFVK